MNTARVAAFVLASVAAIDGGLGAGRPVAQRDQSVHHDLRVVLDPGNHRVAVSDRIRLPVPSERAEFLLNSKLAIARSQPAVDVVPPQGVRSRPPDGSGALTRYRLRRAPPDGVVVLEYSGPIDFALADQKEEYTRGFRETAGLLTDQGVYLAESSGWYPRVGSRLLTFSLQVNVPVGWQVISQGSGTSSDTNGLARWESRDAMDEIYLVGGPLVASRGRSGSIETAVYLHKPDPALAQKYLAAAGQYIDMYSRLIGPYPYDKFALVENFWETGYGMPSFTLLGPEVIRFPFILTTSYPHEILHNWWGNSVFVDVATGNWCEGLTAYLADHLLQEQQGKGAEYRRGALQKYRDYVKESRDFALTAFRARESASTEAVGYGKALMVFHMLRRDLGDDRFTSMLRRLYEQYRGARTSWTDVERVAEAAGGHGLAGFFDEWVSRVGAPALRVEIGAGTAGPAGPKGPGVNGPGAAGSTKAAANAGGFVVRGTIRQVQGGRPYQLAVPVVVRHALGITMTTVRSDGPSVRFDIRCPARPLALDVDPFFDVFRLLDPRETPPSIGQLFGEPRIVAVLPSRAAAGALAAYRSLVAAWQSDNHVIDVALDSEMDRLPADRAVWLLGRENRLASGAFRKQPGLEVNADGLVVEGKRAAFASQSAVLVTRHPENAEKAVGWIIVEPIDGAAALGRKLPHYAKYSYLAFEGREATNTLSGQWRDVDSPLSIDLRPARQRATPLPPLPPDPARPLTRLGY